MINKILRLNSAIILLNYNKNMQRSLQNRLFPKYSVMNFHRKMYFCSSNNKKQQQPKEHGLKRQLTPVDKMMLDLCENVQYYGTVCKDYIWTFIFKKIGVDKNKTQRGNLTSLVKASFFLILSIFSTLLAYLQRQSGQIWNYLKNKLQEVQAKKVKMNLKKLEQRSIQLFKCEYGDNSIEEEMKQIVGFNDAKTIQYIQIIEGCNFESQFKRQIINKRNKNPDEQYQINFINVKYPQTKSSSKEAGQCSAIYELQNFLLTFKDKKRSQHKKQILVIDNIEQVQGCLINEVTRDKVRAVLKELVSLHRSKKVKLIIFSSNNLFFDKMKQQRYISATDFKKYHMGHLSDPQNKIIVKTFIAYDYLVELCSQEQKKDLDGIIDDIIDKENNLKFISRILKQNHLYFVAKFVDEMAKPQRQEQYKTSYPLQLHKKERYLHNVLQNERNFTQPIKMFKNLQIKRLNYRDRLFLMIQIKNHLNFDKQILRNIAKKQYSSRLKQNLSKIRENIRKKLNFEAEFKTETLIKQINLIKSQGQNISEKKKKMLYQILILNQVAHGKVSGVQQLTNFYLTFNKYKSEAYIYLNKAKILHGLTFISKSYAEAFKKTSKNKFMETLLEEAIEMEKKDIVSIIGETKLQQTNTNPIIGETKLQQTNTNPIIEETKMI